MMPVITSSTTATGTSNAMPKHSDIVMTKSRYCVMSGITCVLFGAFWMKYWKITGNTNSYANATPM